MSVGCEAGRIAARRVMASVATADGGPATGPSGQSGRPNGRCPINSGTKSIALGVSGITATPSKGGRVKLTKRRNRKKSISNKPVEWYFGSV